MNKSIFRSAVENDDGLIDIGYLALFWGLVGWSFNNLVILGIAGYATADAIDAASLVQSTGVALGANAGGFATMLGAVGLFRLGDKSQATVAPIAPVAAIAPIAAIAAIAPLAPIAPIAVPDDDDKPKRGKR